MVISTTLQHAMRALGHLATLEPEQSIFGRDLANATAVPVSYLSKIMVVLGRAGLVTATRGLHGGYRLSRPANEITVRQVFEALEPGAADSVCFLHGRRQCSHQDACSIHQRWKLVRDAFDTFLDSSTIADVAPAVSVE